MVFRDKHEYLGNEKSLKSEIAKHKESIQQADISKTEVLLNFSRVMNELKQAKILFESSYKEKLKQELSLLPNDTFYSGAIAHAYYAIFFGTKALLLTAGIKEPAEESIEHAKKFLTHIEKLIA